MKMIIATAGMLLAANAIAQAPAAGQPAGAGMAPTATTAEEWFKQHDANNDGFLSKDEVKTTRTEGNFEKYDTNSDGKLNFAEYKAGRDATEGAASSSSSSSAAAAPAAEGGMGGGMGGGGGGMGGGMGGG